MYRSGFLFESWQRKCGCEKKKSTPAPLTLRLARTDPRKGSGFSPFSCICGVVSAQAYSPTPADWSASSRLRQPQQTTGLLSLCDADRLTASVVLCGRIRGIGIHPSLDRPSVDISSVENCCESSSTRRVPRCCSRSRRTHEHDS